jgi:hypothetical protein
VINKRGAYRDALTPCEVGVDGFLERSCSFITRYSAAKNMKMELQIKKD